MTPQPSVEIAKFHDRFVLQFKLFQKRICFLGVDKTKKKHFPWVFGTLTPRLDDARNMYGLYTTVFQILKKHATIHSVESLR